MGATAARPDGQDGAPANPGQPGSDGATGGSTGTPAQDAAGAGTGGGLDRSKLNPILQNASEDQINELFGVLLQSVPRNDAMSGAPAHARQPEAPAVPAAKEPTKDELREYFDPASDKFDPMAAMKMMTEANYGGLLNDVTRRANGAIKVQMERQLPDFKDYESDVDEYLKSVDPRLVTENTMLQAYFTVKGLKQTQRELKERQRPATTMPPTPSVPVDEGSKLSAEEEQVARVMFPRSTDLAKDFRRAQQMTREGFSVKVPGEK